MLKRFLSEEQGTTEYNIKDLFREGVMHGLIQNLEKWFGYLEARNLTSDTYNENTAEEAYIAAKDFLADAKILLKYLEIKSHD